MTNDRIEPKATSTVALDLVFEPFEGRVSVVRTFVEQYFGPVVADRDHLARVAMAAHELLENACKYSIGGPPRLRIEVTRGSGKSRLAVHVSNQPKREDLVALKEIVADLQTDQDLDALYLRYMTRAARRTEGSGLGMVRIRVEAGMALSAEIVGDTVCVTASLEVEKEHRR